MARRIPTRLTSAEGRRFGLTVGAASLVLTGIAWWRGHPTVVAMLGPLSGVLLFAGLVIPTHLGPVQRAWMGLAHLISKVTTPVFLGIVYFMVIAPIGILMRIFFRNPILRNPSGDSFWVARDQAPERQSSMSRQF